jgi:hypothetical protein
VLPLPEAGEGLLVSLKFREKVVKSVRKLPQANFNKNNEYSDY